jgi:insertion element IS1 protein InsB
VYDRTHRQLLAWVAGGRMAQSLSRLRYLFAPVKAVAVHTDAFAVYPAGLDGYAHIVSKAGTQRVESDNGRMRDYFARFTRKTKAVTRSLHMLNLTIRLYAHYHFKDNLFKLISILK